VGRSSAFRTPSHQLQIPWRSSLGWSDGGAGRRTGSRAAPKSSARTSTPWDDSFRVRNRSEYPPQPKNPKGEIHEDEGLFSYDRAQTRLVLRQFHEEGFVNTYLGDNGDPSGKLVFSSEAIENIPPGLRARETYVFIGTDQLEEIFELAEPGKDFEVYSRARLERVK
jgi:hypothetical protein